MAIKTVNKFLCLLIEQLNWGFLKLNFTGVHRTCLGHICNSLKTYCTLQKWDLKKFYKFTNFRLAGRNVTIYSALYAWRIRKAKHLQYWYNFETGPYESKLQAESHKNPLQSTFRERVQFHPLCVSRIDRETPLCPVHEACICVEHIFGQLSSSANSLYRW